MSRGEVREYLDFGAEALYSEPKLGFTLRARILGQLAWRQTPANPIPAPEASAEDGR